jgi:hypothetical protein
MTVLSRRAVQGILAGAMATALLAISIPAGADYTEHWRIEAADASFITGNLARTMAYNPVTDTILIPHRESGNHVARINAADGTLISASGMDTTGVSGGAITFNSIAVVDLGGDAYSVYVSNVATNVNTGALRIYRWHSDGSSGVETENTLGAPSVVYSNRTDSGADPSPIGPPLPNTTKQNPRVGDDMTATHSGGTTTLYLSVGTVSPDVADLIYLVRINEATGTVTSVEPFTTTGMLGAQTWGAAIDSLGNYYNMTNNNTRYYDADGNQLASIPTTTIGSNSARPRPMVLDGRRYFGYIERDTTPAGTTLRVLDVHDGVGTATEYLATDAPGAPVANNAAMGGGVAVDVRGRFVGMISNNMIVSFSDEEVLLAELASLTASVNEPSGTVTINWETASEIDNVGFNVYRAADNSKVNAILIPSAGNGASYSLVDSQVLAPGESRSYILEDVDANGVTSTHGPVTATRSGSNSSVAEWPLF